MSGPYVFDSAPRCPYCHKPFVLHDMDSSTVHGLSTYVCPTFTPRQHTAPSSTHLERGRS